MIVMACTLYLCVLPVMKSQVLNWECEKKPLSPDVIQCLAEGVTPVMFVDTVTPADVLQEADVAKSGRM